MTLGCLAISSSGSKGFDFLPGFWHSIELIEQLVQKGFLDMIRLKALADLLVHVPALGWGRACPGLPGGVTPAGEPAGAGLAGGAFRARKFGEWA